jgi:carbon storage regulator
MGFARESDIESGAPAGSRSQPTTSKGEESRMLVLSRKIGEKIHVGNDVTIEVRRVAGNRVTLAVDAPREVRNLRGELKDAATAFEPEDPQQPTATSAETVVVTHERMSAMHDMPHAMG